MSYNKKSRIENSKKNIIYGLIGKIAQLCLKFLLRTVIIFYFGAIYLGLDGLFMNIISVLSIAELGIGNAICYALYKPFAEEDVKSLSAHIKLFGKLYKFIGLFIFVAGILCTPVLKYIVNFNDNISVNYYIIYILFLLNTVVTYLFGAHYQVVFTADQREYFVNNTKNIVYFITVIIQTVLIVITKNYYIYLVIMIIGSITTNLIISFQAHKDYFYIFEIENAKLSQDEKNKLKKNIFALTLTKISTVVYTSSDNIVISGIIGTIVVGYYSNYAYIVSAITGIIAIIFNGMLASIGNFKASESSDKLLIVYKRMLFLNMIIYGVSYVCLHNLIQDFIKIWAGQDYILNNITVAIICLMFLLPGLNHTNTLFKDACGLFWETRYRTVATAIINITLSILLAPHLGLSGVFLATIISYFSTTFLVDAKIIMEKSLKCRKRVFYLWYVKSFVSIAVCDFILKMLLKNYNVTNIISFAVKSIICILFSIALLILINIKSNEFAYFKNIIKKMIVRDKNGK